MYNISPLGSSEGLFLGRSKDDGAGEVQVPLLASAPRTFDVDLVDGEEKGRKACTGLGSTILFLLALGAAVNVDNGFPSNS